MQINSFHKFDVYNTFYWLLKIPVIYNRVLIPTLLGTKYSNTTADSIENESYNDSAMIKDVSCRVFFFLQQTFAYNWRKPEEKECFKENICLCIEKEGRFMVIHAPSLRTHISISRYITTLVTAGCYWNNFIIRI